MTNKLTPQQINRFKVAPLGLSDDITEAFSSAVTRVELALNHKNLVVNVQQNAGADELKAIIMMVANNTPVYVDMLNINGSVAISLFPIGCNLVSHEMVLDKTVDGTLVHRLEYSFRDISYNNERRPVDTNNAKQSIDFTPISELAYDEEVKKNHLPLNNLKPVPLDLSQEMRITPDNPDTDGDGVPDRMDKFPNDPTRQ